MVLGINHDIQIITFVSYLIQVWTWISLSDVVRFGLGAKSDEASVTCKINYLMHHAYYITTMSCLKLCQLSQLKQFNSLLYVSMEEKSMKSNNTFGYSFYGNNDLWLVNYILQGNKKKEIFCIITTHLRKCIVAS